MISKTLLSTTILGDFHEHEDEYHIRIFGDEKEPGHGIYWIDFQIFEVIGYDWGAGVKGRKFFNLKKSPRSPEPVYTYDEAAVIVEGFVKWDGCTQFDFPEGIHVDSKRHLDALFSAVCRARELASEAMPGKMINDDYGGPMPIDEPLAPSLTVAAIDTKAGTITLK